MGAQVTALKRRQWLHSVGLIADVQLRAPPYLIKFYVFSIKTGQNLQIYIELVVVFVVGLGKMWKSLKREWVQYSIAFQSECNASFK